jgi:hypothetical protein
VQVHANAKLVPSTRKCRLARVHLVDLRRSGCSFGRFAEARIGGSVLRVIFDGSARSSRARRRKDNDRGACYDEARHKSRRIVVAEQQDPKPPAPFKRGDTADNDPSDPERASGMEPHNRIHERKSDGTGNDAEPAE